MADLTLPCDLPGLLRRGSPVRIVANDIDRIIGRSATVVHTGGGGLLVSLDGPETSRSLVTVARAVALDLTDATGRAHAAWWLDERIRSDAFGTILGHEKAKLDLSRFGLLDALMMANRGMDMRHFEIHHLRTACLRAAGRTDAT